MKKGKIALITICALSGLFLAIILITTIVKKPVSKSSVSSDMTLKMPAAAVTSTEAETSNSKNITDEVENSASSNVVSSNTASENSVSENTVSENSVSDNSSTPSEPETTTTSYCSNPDSPVIQYKAGDVLSAPPSNPESYFVISSISDETFNYINGRSYQENPYISRDDLRYIKLIHYNFNHQVQVGELIVNKSVADKTVSIFKQLYSAEYEIEKMYLPDRYWTGDGNETDTASCDDNNTSAFFYRVVDGSSKLSKHARGLAIDINPQQNPYVDYRSGQPECIHENALAYIDRTTGLAHVITEDDLCYKLFTQNGYKWGGAWKNIKDYQHFEVK